ncbi:hypothetical protein BJ170DRAFT_364333 [Xylariales sp. AK1849]|nr:hypothetical protein BJ170DRAFT_364333 [Xylariales sp. AK1849]
MSVVDRILEAVPRNEQLLTTLSTTSYAPLALEEHKRYVAALDEKLAILQQDIQSLDQKREKEFRVHKSYRDSVLKRFAYRVSGQTGKFTARAEKEQREYFDALQQEHQAKVAEQRLQDQRFEALDTQSKLETTVARYTQAQSELDALYDGIFKGPTPEFPEEDKLEQGREEALRIYHTSVAALESDQQVANLVTDAKRKAKSALDEVREALSGGHMASSTTERRTLQNADRELNAMQDLVAQARRISPRVASLTPVRIQYKLAGGDAHDNPDGRTAFHDRIRIWRTAIEINLDTLSQQVELAKSRCHESDMELDSKLQALEVVKAELSTTRARIFEDIEALHAAKATEIPPPY